MRTQKIPELVESEEEGFNAFVAEHYRTMIEQAFQIAKKVGYAHPDGRIEAEAELGFARAVFDKLASPRVFLIQHWRKLDAEERIAYYSPETQRKMHEDMETAKMKGHLQLGAVKT